MSQKIKKYLVTMTPLEPYTFGNEQGFVYPGEKKTGKESYFVKSNEMPTQTMVLGLLRYLVLQQEGLLRSDFRYSEEEQGKMSQYIGAESFSFSKDIEQDFGFIHEVSPVFLVNEKKEILIRNPFHNKAEKSGYKPMEMEDGIETSAGTISLPKEEEYDAKVWHATGFYNLTTEAIEKKLFRIQVVSGNRKNEKNGSDDDCFFKRELIILEKGYSFAAFVEAERLPAKTIGYMGKKKSAFGVEACEVEDSDLAGMVESAFYDSKDVWFYALGDILTEDSLVYDNFCIVEEKQQRNLETVHSESKHLHKLKKSEIRYHLIESGSVFYKSCSVKCKNPNLEKIGYNKLVRLGGK